MKYSSEEKCYIVTVPDLPGCMADGRTPNEAFENVKNANIAEGQNAFLGDTGTIFWAR